MSDAEVEVIVKLTAATERKLRLLARQRGVEASQMVKEWVERELGDWVIDFNTASLLDQIPTTEATLTEARSLERALADLSLEYQRLQQNDPRRPELARMIRQLEAEIEHRKNRADRSR